MLGSFRQFGVAAYSWATGMPPAMRVFFERPWLEGNITVDRGPLAGAYVPNNGAVRSEGDSPRLCLGGAVLPNGTAPCLIAAVRFTNPAEPPHQYVLSSEGGPVLTTALRASAVASRRPPAPRTREVLDGFTGSGRQHVLVERQHGERCAWLQATLLRAVAFGPAAVAGQTSSQWT